MEFLYGGGGILLQRKDDREVLNPSMYKFTSHWLISHLCVDYFLYAFVCLALY